MLAEVAATDISLVRNPQGLNQTVAVAVEGAKTHPFQGLCSNWSLNDVPSSSRRDILLKI